MAEDDDERGDAEERRIWPHARAFLVLFHLTAVCILSIPASGAMRDISAWRAPHAQRELAVWAERARSLGWDVSQTEFEAWLWDLAHGYLEVRDQIAAPFGLYAQYSGAIQGWSMFANPQTEPAWLTIDVQGADGAYRTVYRERSSTEAWMRRQLDHNRVRKLQGRFGRGAYDDFYRGLVDWLAQRAASEFPDATHLRARVERRRTPEPWGDAEDGYQSSRFERELVVDLETFR
jgi:hypothetical protein